MAASPSSLPNDFIGYQVTIAAAIFSFLASVAFLLRIVARRMQRVEWGMDDWFAVSGFLFFHATIACCLVDVYAGGVGYHRVVVEQTPAKIRIVSQMAVVIPVFYLLAAALPKLSIICFYLRIFKAQANPTERKLCYATGVLVIANCIGSMIPAFVACRPLNYLWTERQPGDVVHCIDFNAWYRWGSMTNILTDAILILLPMPAVKNLHVSRKVRVSLAVTFGLGSLGVITGVLRFASFFSIDSDSDGTWTTTHLLLMTIVECGMYFISACLLTMKPILHGLSEKLEGFASRLGSKGDGQKGKVQYQRRRWYGQSQSCSQRKEEDSQILVTQLVGVDWSRSRTDADLC